MTKEEKQQYVKMLKEIIQEIEDNRMQSIQYSMDFPCVPKYKIGSSDPVSYSREGCSLIREFTFIRKPEKTEKRSFRKEILDYALKLSKDFLEGRTDDD